MADGFIKQATISQYVNTSIHTVTAGRYAEFTVRLLNTTTSPINLSVAISTTTNPASNEYIEQGLLIPAKSSVLVDNMTASAGKNIVIQSTAGGITASVYGTEITAT